jgi:hypothetical protein
MTASVAFPGPEDWVRIPGETARVHRSDLKPCRQCGATMFRIVRVHREARQDDGSTRWIDRGASIECPRCPLVSEKKGDRRETIAWMEMATGAVRPINPRDGRWHEQEQCERGEGDPGERGEEVRAAGREHPVKLAMGQS